MFYGCNVSCNQLPTSSNGDWSALIQRFSPHSYSIIYKRKEEGRFLPDFRSRLEVGVSSPKMMNKKESLIRSFQQEMKRANQQTFPAYVDSFTNLWQYEFGTLDGLPKDIEQFVASRALELELME